jgi:hypothetical protein
MLYKNRDTQRKISFAMSTASNKASRNENMMDNDDVLSANSPNSIGETESQYDSMSDISENNY